MKQLLLLIALFNLTSCAYWATARTRLADQMEDCQTELEFQYTDLNGNLDDDITAKDYEAMREECETDSDKAVYTM